MNLTKIYFIVLKLRVVNSLSPVLGYLNIQIKLNLIKARLAFKKIILFNKPEFVLWFAHNK